MAQIRCGWRHGCAGPAGRRRGDSNGCCGRRPSRRWRRPSSPYFPTVPRPGTAGAYHWRLARACGGGASTAAGRESRSNARPGLPGDAACGHGDRPRAGGRSRAAARLQGCYGRATGGRPSAPVRLAAASRAVSRQLRPVFRQPLDVSHARPPPPGGVHSFRRCGSGHAPSSPASIAGSSRVVSGSIPSRPTHLLALRSAWSRCSM